MSLQARSAARSLSRLRRTMFERPALWIALSAMAAVGFSLIVWFVSTSVAWFASSPSSDRLFGNLNQCVMSALPASRAGFAVSPDGRSIASFSGDAVAICSSSKMGARAEVAGRTVALPGVTQLAWDFGGTLWAATASRGDSPGALWRILPSALPLRVGDVTPVALAGGAGGVVALDARGKLLSVSHDGAANAFIELPASIANDAQLSVDASGQLAALVSSGGLLVFHTADLSRVLAEAPCEVEYLWWLAQPSTALLSCGPGASWALVLHALTGDRNEAPRKVRERSTLVQRLGAWVRPCDGLPCEAAAP